MRNPAAAGSFQFDPPTPETLSALLPNYAFESLIAKGGMGAVYKARQLSLDRDVAIKILPRELGSDPEFRASFDTEARAMAKLNHANLIGVYDSGSVDGMPFLVMEYVHGKSLYHSAFRRKLEPAEAVRLMRAVLEGLASAHEAGIIHRDIKPANILLTPKAEPKIGDFGLARHTDAEEPGLAMGTPGYTAPEVLKDPSSADRRSDLYAVGVILYELLTGQQPKPGCQAPSAIAKSPVGLDAVWQRATHPNPAFRYPDAYSMSAALEAALKSSTPVGTVLRKPAAKLATPPATAPARAVAAAAAAKESKTTAEQPAESTPATPPPAAFEIKTEIESNWNLVIKFLLIAALLVAVAFTWKALQKHKKTVAEKNRRATAEQVQREMQAQAAKEALARKLAEEAAKPKPDPAKPVVTPPTPTPEPEPETPLQALERLRRNLAAGEREELPAGSIRRGDLDFFLVTTPMPWHEAAAFAEQHGGHLFLPRADEDLTWIAEATAKSSAQAVWIGVGRDEGQQWVLLDGTPWKPADKPRGTGAYVAVTRLGLLRATPASDKLPFFIQWHRDGSNPATLDAMLQRVRQSLGQPDPDFPPGTLTFQSRHYLLVPRPMTWLQASEVAERAGGHLAVPSDNSEAIWIEETLKEQSPGTTVWIGGRRSDLTWFWTSGEPWTFAHWAKDKPPAENADFAAIGADGQWTALPAEQTAAALLIEWSPDQLRASDKATDVAPAAAGLAPLQKKARELITAAAKEREKLLAANARTYTWDIDVWFRSLAKKDQDTWGAHVQKLKECLQGTRVPTEIPAEAAIQMSPRMSAIVQFCARKQAEADAGYQLKLTQIRDSYLAKLRQQLADAEKRGQSELVRTIRGAANAANVEPEQFPAALGSDTK